MPPDAGRFHPYPGGFRGRRQGTADAGPAQRCLNGQEAPGYRARQACSILGSVDSPRTSGIGQRRSAAQRGNSRAYTTRREEVIKAGAEVFSELGFTAASLKDVADRLGTDRATIYYYVSSKGELFQAVTESAVHEVMASAEATAATPRSAAERLADLIVATMAAYERHYPYLFAYIQEDMNRVQADADGNNWSSTMADYGKRYERAVVSIIEDGLADGTFVSSDPTVAAYGIIGAMNWTHRWYQPDGHLSATEIGQVFADMLVAGLARQS